MLSWLKGLGSNVERSKVSVVINTLNEEKNIAACIDSVKAFADEIIVVDMHSKDRTVPIAKEYNASVYDFEPVGYVEPGRNFAISKANFEWVLVIDADERFKVSDLNGLKDFLKSNLSVDAFYLPHQNKLLDRWMKGTGWGPDKERHLRLFRRSKLNWPKEIHSTPIVYGVIGELPSTYGVYFEHFNYVSLEDFLTRLNRYTTQEALKLKNKNETFDAQKALQAAFQEFHLRYEPAKDSTHSFVLATMMAFYRFSSWAKLWELNGYQDITTPQDTKKLFEAMSEYVSSMINTPPAPPQVVSYTLKDPNVAGEYSMNGFYGDEGGWRWGQPYASIEIFPSFGKKKVNVKFKVRCAEVKNYLKIPFEFKILVNDKVHSSAIFKTDWQDINFDLTKDIGTESLVVRLEADSKTKNAPEDLRSLAIIFSDFQINYV